MNAIRTAYEAIIHEHAVESADRSGNRDDYYVAGNAMWDDDQSFREYCEGAEMTEKEIEAALSLKNESDRSNI